MKTLTEFLLARIAEDEAAAREVCDPSEDGAWSEFGEFPSRFGPDHHVTRWSPTRVLVQCEAKRRIVELFPFEEPGDGWDEAGQQVLELLALPYADHPDYRPEWKP